jgi:hypothetical protein
MNFLDPEEWNDLEALERQYQELDEELIKDLHNKLRPYFLRRIKSEVLELPPKVVDLHVSLLDFSNDCKPERSYSPRFNGTTSTRSLSIYLK